MFIDEVLGKSVDDIILESDEFVLKSMLDTIILSVKDALKANQTAQITLDQIIQELNKNTETVYIDPTDEDRRNQIIQALEEHGLAVERGSGLVSIGIDNHGVGKDNAEVEKKERKKEVSRKAMDKIKKDGEEIGADL